MDERNSAALRQLQTLSRMERNDTRRKWGSASLTTKVMTWLFLVAVGWFFYLIGPVYSGMIFLFFVSSIALDKNRKLDEKVLELEKKVDGIISNSTVVRVEHSLEGEKIVQ